MAVMRPLLAFSGCGHATTARFQRLRSCDHCSLSAVAVMRPLLAFSGCFIPPFLKEVAESVRPEDFTVFRSLPENIGKLVRISLYFARYLKISASS